MPKRKASEKKDLGQNNLEDTKKSRTSEENMKLGQVYIGTSGYCYREWRKGVFYPRGLTQKNEFAYYSTKFSTLEINNSFYTTPKISVWKSWYDRAPKDGFIYTVKVNQFLTHRKKLKDPEEIWNRIFEGASCLKEHLGPFLFQLPNHWGRDPNRLDDLAKVLPENQRFAFEFRDKSWFHSSVYEVLKKHNWALVILPPGNAFDLPCVEEITADFTFLRWHGATGKYQGSYSDDYLKEWTDKIVKFQKRGIDVYGYFNNTDEDAAAAKDALTLKGFLKDWGV